MMQCGHCNQAGIQWVALMHTYRNIDGLWEVKCLMESHVGPLTTRNIDIDITQCGVGS